MILHKKINCRTDRVIIFAIGFSFISGISCDDKTNIALSAERSSASDYAAHKIMHL